MGLPDELVHLRVRGQVHDDVGLRVLDAVDPAGERCVVSGEVLEQVPEFVRPGVLALVDAEDLMAFLLQSVREIRPDLSGGPGEQDLSCRDRRALRTAQRGRGGARDQDVDELAREPRRP